MGTRRLDDQLANSLLEQPFLAGEHIYVDVDDGRQVIVVREEVVEDPEQVPSESGESDSQDAKSEPSQEGVVDSVSVPESDNGKAETESTKDSSVSDEASLKDSKLEMMFPPPLSELAVSV